LTILKRRQESMPTNWARHMAASRVPRVVSAKKVWIQGSSRNMSKSQRYIGVQMKSARGLSNLKLYSLASNFQQTFLKKQSWWKNATWW
jgi:hypothetical protein